MRLHAKDPNVNWRIRPDGRQKVTGKLKYLTDLSFPNMLYGKILRSEYPHAEIVSIDIERAKRLPGVRAVVTYKDIPGLNGFGLIFPDQPVFCSDRVRFVGDALAAVAAESKEIAEQALKCIDVEYRELPVLDSPEKSLEPNAPCLHPAGNILHRSSHKKGEVEKGFQECCVVVEETYQLPRQMHAYMETEGGVVVPEENGKITVYAGTQHGFKDRFQLARILDVQEKDIRIISSPIGGSFGGKDELNIQPYGALLALASKCPVKIHQTRQESVRSGLKRHPMQIKMKTGADKHGNILAHQAVIVADTGAYATLGPAVLDFAVEHAVGPYRVPNVEVEGLSVFTNNGVSGEFRGFGGNQVTFALEGQIDRLADKLKISPLQLRRRNLRKKKDPGPLEQRIAATDGAMDVLEKIEGVLNEKYKLPGREYGTKITGRGVAISMHGGGLGRERLDPAGGRLSLREDGKIEAAFGFEECGQGLLAVIETLLIEEFACSPEEIHILIGDTDAVPISGSSTASRATSMVWQALQKMKIPFRNKLLEAAGEILGVSVGELRLGPGGIREKCATSLSEGRLLLTFPQLAAKISKDRSIIEETSFDFPVSPDPIVGSHYLYAFSACLVEVEVDLLTGRVTVLDMHQAIAAGPVVSPMGYLGQIEGGGVMALGYTLMEQMIMENGVYVTDNFDSYMIPVISDVPFQMNVEAIEQLAEGDLFGPRGVGEIGTVAVAPAITRAIYEATGFWANQLPVSPEKLLIHMSERR